VIKYLLDTNICIYFLKGQFDLHFDLLIGSTAIYNNLTLVTRNVSDFDRLEGIIIEDWTSE